MKNLAPSSPAVKRLVLIGGGHSHLAVLMHLGMKPVPGLEVVLITRDIQAPYSGALPGFIAGVYQFNDIHIDLRPLCQFAGVRLIHQEVEHLDLEGRRVLCKDRPPIRYDALSLNIGSRPDVAKIPGAARFAIGVKPIDRFLESWQQVSDTAAEKVRNSEPYAIAIVGGGPASVELAFSAQTAIRKAAGIAKDDTSSLAIKLVTADTQLLKFHNNRVKDFTRAELERRGVELYFDHRVTEFEANTIICDGKDPVTADSIFFATGASIPQWPADCGLAVDENGFIAVNTFLQSINHPAVFACGDAASIVGHPRPKSGVFAVRQGMPLAHNLVRFVTGRKLRKFIPQRHALALMYTGDNRAIASRRNWFFHGRWVWALKHKIDMDFMNRYARLPTPEPELQLKRGLTDAATEQALQEHVIRCAGCAAKVGSSTLRAVLESLQPHRQPDLEGDLAAAEDAALIRLSSDRMLVQTVDYFRAFINDPWLFARIAANHCVGDIYAMGARPHTALAIASVPFAAATIMQETLDELMAGCVRTLNEHDTALAGGHSNEARELAFGLTVNGYGHPERLLSKTGAQPGDALLLCKPLGTGTLLAADMRLKARGSWMETALEQMLVSNRSAADCFVNHGASACTDITGFGLAGHLAEMLAGGRVGASLELDAMPVLPGAAECLGRKIFSSLHSDNSQVRKIMEVGEGAAANPLLDIVFDPQTAGGLLAAVPGNEASRCLEKLQQLGYPDARIIGHVTESGSAEAAIRIT
ncbi:MAG: selenide, water dikinase SelD [Gammaproteobacteria bacterium]|nr:selenide, water dikinase SelD [Pseudomonadales bacterium]MCP5345382.1 selenide, water dikinase SelD [Pseudomonadales bacterium]